jgi:hypothetical protein
MLLCSSMLFCEKNGIRENCSHLRREVRQSLPFFLDSMRPTEFKNGIELRHKTLPFYFSAIKLRRGFALET